MAAGASAQYRGCKQQCGYSSKTGGGIITGIKSRKYIQEVNAVIRTDPVRGRGAIYTQNTSTFRAPGDDIRLPEPPSSN